MRSRRFPGTASDRQLVMKEFFAPRCSPDLGDLAKEIVRAALERAAATSFPHYLLLAVDGTCGNGRDTLFLAQTLLRLRPEGKALVLTFDVQTDALVTARKRLNAHCPTAEVRFVAAGHETLVDHLPPDAAFFAAMYNLGFLPGSDKLVVTRPETTLCSLRFALEHLHPGGVCAVHAYGAIWAARKNCAPSNIFSPSCRLTLFLLRVMPFATSRATRKFCFWWRNTEAFDFEKVVCFDGCGADVRLRNRLVRFIAS
jgi:hypothetical protein